MTMSPRAAIRSAMRTRRSWVEADYLFLPAHPLPDGGAYVTAGDLDRFLREAKAGSLLSPQSTSVFFTPQVVHHTVEDWDLVYGTGCGSLLIAPGTSCSRRRKASTPVSAVIRRYPDQDVNVVLLANIQGHEEVAAIDRQLTAG